MDLTFFSIVSLRKILTMCFLSIFVLNDSGILWLILPLYTEIVSFPQFAHGLLTLLLYKIVYLYWEWVLCSVYRRHARGKGWRKVCQTCNNTWTSCRLQDKSEMYKVVPAWARGHTDDIYFTFQILRYFYIY